MIHGAPGAPVVARAPGNRFGVAALVAVTLIVVQAEAMGASSGRYT